MKIVGYVRVSTEEQHLGLQAQRQALEDWCAKNDHELIVTHEDHGVSGAAPVDDRPGLLRAIEDVRANEAGALLILRRDRLARDVVIAAVAERMVQSIGAKIVTTDGSSSIDGPEGQLMRTIIDAVAQYERALIRARVKSALAVKKAKGERTGDIPIGYSLSADGKTLVKDQKEQVAVKRIRSLRQSGKTLRQIADYLGKHGIPCRGRKWYPMTVKRVLDAHGAA